MARKIGEKFSMWMPTKMIGKLEELVDSGEFDSLSSAVRRFVRDHGKKDFLVRMPIYNTKEREKKTIRIRPKDFPKKLNNRSDHVRACVEHELFARSGGFMRAPRKKRPK